jgi:hypothetical protein
MASTYSPSLKITLPGDGDQAGIWGQTTNTNLGTLIEQAITGVVSIVMSNANYTLSNFNGVSDEARNAVLVVTGANSAVRDVIPPVVEKLYTVVNNTTGGFAIRVIGATGTGVSIPPGITTLVYCDGTNFIEAMSSAAVAVNTSNYTIEQQGSTLVTQYNGANVSTLTSAGTLNVVQALTTPLVTATTANATTVNATTVNATTVNATTVNASNVAATNFKTTNFTITESGGKLQFIYGANVIASMDSTGNLISATNITAFGTP